MNSENNLMEKGNERGFILITTILILAILTIVGTAAWFKTNVQMSLSTTVVESGQAFAAANAGLETTYAYWSFDSSGQVEYSDIKSDIVNDTAVSGIYIDLLDPYSMDDLNAIATSTYSKTDINDLISSTTGVPSGIRVYNITASGITEVSNSSWGTSDPQVAVWATSFSSQDEPDYPYGVNSANANTTSCSSCNLVVYALGRSGNSKRLIRQAFTYVTSNIEGVSAITNAPAFDSFSEMYNAICSDSVPLTDTANTPGAKGATEGLLVIDVTQSTNGDALKSNADIGRAGKAFRDGVSSNPSLTIDSNPSIIFDPTVASGTGSPQVDQDKQSPSSTNPPFIERNATIDWFTDLNKHLFNLDIYREAANTIRTGTKGWTTATEKGIDYTLATDRDGPYNLSGGNSGIPRSGTLTVREFMYNVQRAIPMYGIVRVLVPTLIDSGGDFGSGLDCNVPSPGTDFTIYTQNPQVSRYGVLSAANVLAQTGDGGGEQVDIRDMDISAAPASATNVQAKVIVYGLLFVDYYHDSDDNGLYDAANDKLFTPVESVDIYMKIHIPLIINPALDGTHSGLADDSASGTKDYTHVSAAKGKWYGMDMDDSPDGEMDLMTMPYTSSTDPSIFEVATSTRGFGSSGSITYFDSVASGREPQAGLWNMINHMSNRGHAGGADLALRLAYFYNTKKAASVVGMDNFPSSLVELQDFYIGNNGTGTTPDGADAFHLLSPSGYIHGWRRAFQVTGMPSSIWNDNLIATTSSYYDERAKYMHVSSDADGVMIDSDFADIPAEIYSGGLLDMHGNVNVSGVLYTPMQIELEAKNDGNYKGTAAEGPARQYINGSLIGGFGVYIQNAKQGSVDGTDDGLTYIVYDPVAVDKLSTNDNSVITSRRYWQELQ
ncbi:MAG: pilus assembly PilX N-terminal domain-containing protein [Mariprofundaceae bacterium]